MVIKIITRLEKTIAELQVDFNKEMERLRKNQSQMKNTIDEIKTTLEGMKSRLEDAEEWISNGKYSS